MRAFLFAVFVALAGCGGEARVSKAEFRNLAGDLGQVAEAVRADRSFKDLLDEINLDEIVAAVEELEAAGYQMVKRVA